MKRLSPFFLVLTIALLTMGCILTGAPAPTATPLPVEPTTTLPVEVSDVPPEPTNTPAPTDPLAACPAPTEGTTLYASRENGYCFLVPAGFTVQPDGQRPAESVMLIGPTESGGGMEPATLTMWVANNGPARGLTSEAYGRMWHQHFVGAEAPINAAPGTIGGQPALVLSDIPGMIARRGGFVVANGVKYEVMILPQPGSTPELTAPGEAAWETVTSSIVFFPPENTRVYRTPEEACPVAGSDTKLMVNEANGYCFLYPADFESSELADDWVVGGPVLGSIEGFENIRTSLAPGAFGAFPDKSPRDMLAMREPGTYDPASVADITIGGFPAVTYRDTGGPWLSRLAMINVNGMYYTIVAQPWEPDRWPEGIPHLERVWSTVTGSMQFFTPWR